VSRRRSVDRDHICAVECRDLAGEHRDTERAITLWHRKASDGRLPHLTEFDFHRLASDWGYRFLISGDKFLDAAVFIVYGSPLARLLDLPEKPKPNVSVFQQIPARYRDLFIEGCTEMLVQPEPARFSGAVRHDGRIELHRAAFMPLRGSHPSRPLIFGSFNYRVVSHDSAVDRFPKDDDWLAARRREARPTQR
jgi:hypothetical protein